MSFIFFQKDANLVMDRLLFFIHLIIIMSESKDSKKWFPYWVSLLMLILWPVPLIIVLLIWSPALK